MYTVDELLNKMVELKASDLHMTVGVPPTYRINGELVRSNDEILKPQDTEEFAKLILTMEQYETFKTNRELDLCISRPNAGRYRINIFHQRNSVALVLRLVNSEIPSIDELGLPLVIQDVAKKTKGLFLVTGPTGSGKSTTLAAIIELINRNRNAHVITLEDPIEYLHKHKKSIINQREIGDDSRSYANALRAALREDPDVILVGEMRDLETISIALTAAETGHLVLSTLHTTGAAATIDRIIDVFPPVQQIQIKAQLSDVLIGVFSQALIPRADKEGRVLAYETMMLNAAIRNLIREGKTYQIATVMQTSIRVGMITFEQHLQDLYERGIISKGNMEIL